MNKRNNGCSAVAERLPGVVTASDARQPGDDVVVPRRAKHPSQPPFYNTGFYPVGRCLGNVVPGRIIRITTARIQGSFSLNHDRTLIRQFQRDRPFARIDQPLEHCRTIYDFILHTKDKIACAETSLPGR